jgi:uncharacterized protein with FMN-binding domain
LIQNPDSHEDLYNKNITNMESAERLQKNMGIILGCIVIFAVGAVTFFEEAGPNIASTTPINMTSSSGTSNTITQNPPSNTPAVLKIYTVSNKTPPATTPIIPTITPVIVPKQTASVYTDGTYSATGSYGSPGGQEQLSVTLSLINDIITAVSVTPGAYDRRSQNYQNAFISGYKQYVLGKNIADVNLTRISGSSLTPIGFNNALAQIKAKAKA